MRNAKQSHYLFLAYIFSGSFAIFALLLGISIGSVHIPLLLIIQTLGEALFQLPVSSEQQEQVRTLIMSIRLPRVLLSFLIGAALAVSGTALQGLLKNPLADPYTLGVSSGASLGAVIVLFFQLQLPLLKAYTLPFVSVCMALLTLCLIIFISTSMLRKLTAESIILMGIIFGSFLSAVISLLIALSGEELRQIIIWLLGSVSMRGWTYIQLFLPFFIIGMVIMFVYVRDLHALTFGDEIAQSLGVHVWKSKMLILFAASLLTGGAVAVSGAIGFIGLIVPHATRLYIRSNYRHLLPLSLLNGGSFLVVADLISRTVIIPRELPIGVITALVGAPIFAVLLIRKYNK